MLNYEQLTALTCVHQEGSFQRAARKLHITQSAVSQRIRALETLYGAPVLIREDPLRLTALGEKLVQHAHAVQRLERDLSGSESQERPGDFHRIRLGVNADSLATWFFKASAKIFLENRVTVDLLVDNEDHTLELLRRGEVSGCISSQKRSVPGAFVEALGVMSYQCVCSPKFFKEFFKKGLSVEALADVPTVIFDAKDTAHELFLKQHFGIKMPTCPYHLVPTNEGFLQTVLSGAAFGMIPSVQAKSPLKSGELIDLGKGRKVHIKLYLHWIIRQGSKLQNLHKELVAAARDELEKMA
jgi:LysR family transcriptional regulator (chromosome initiation inhibitor)